jgi:hypothetical protein
LGLSAGAYHEYCYVKEKEEDLNLGKGDFFYNGDMHNFKYNYLCRHRNRRQQQGKKFCKH